MRKLASKANVTVKVLQQSFPWYAMFLTKVFEYIRNLAARAGHKIQSDFWNNFASWLQ